ncbi:MAG: 4-hydroxy-tetrahydrodipicolinate reductase [Clostridiales bacterium]|jgi:4-hydroxy-tetrahydrodipicolinate reductase|nr:4-hydroxy-tetrahydrodipicolinate reductase [Clostridiales bacterium]
MIKLLINGACGQMGHTVIRLAQSLPDAFLVAAGIDGCGLTESEGVPVLPSLQNAPQDADVLIDFSRPEAVSDMAAFCQKTDTRLIVGTTGLGKAEMDTLRHAAKKTAIFQCGNMSLGVNLQIELVKNAAATLSEQFDVEIVEKHHNRKVDSPSGTALMLADAMSAQYAKGRSYVYGRHSKNQRRAHNEIGIHALRGGTIVGEHEVIFYGQDEVVSIRHQAYSKNVFAAGALRAAQYLMQKQTGLYNMESIVTEHSVMSHLYTDENQSVITVSALPDEPGALQAIFGAIAEKEVFVDMISLTTPSGKTAEISFSLPKNGLATALNALKALRRDYPGMDVYALDNLTKITVEGPGMALRHGVAGELFGVFAKAGVSIELVTTSETKISCCVKNSDVSAALTAIMAEFQL